MNKQFRHRLLALIAISAATVIAAWVLIHSTRARRHRLRQPPDYLSNFAGAPDADLWTQAVEQVKADRGEPAGGSAAVEVPPELRHYSDRHWFLATQVAEVRKNNIQTCQDFVDLAAMIKRGELVALPAVTDTYILLGVGAKADEGVFSRYQDDHSIGLYNDAQLRDEYQRLEATRGNLEQENVDLKKQLGALKKRDRARQRELQKQIAARQQELRSTEENKALLNQFYGHADSRQKLFRDYDSLQSLARNFGGRSYDLNNSTDRQAMKVNMLSSVRPEALKVMEEIATDYHQKFERPLPVSSLVRPEQYQHALNKVNRNAVLIDTPPHSTGLAFDIDYRYMSGAEQSFVMAELARMKDAGRIEVIRERNANYHVFVFLDGVRPGDELIAASLDEAVAPVKKSNHATRKPVNDRRKSQKAKSRNVKAKGKRR